jgi:subtilase family serine protease
MNKRYRERRSQRLEVDGVHARATGNDHPSKSILFEDPHPTESKKLLDDLQNPASPHYGQYLTPEQEHARFGGTEMQFRAVKNWLIQQHFRIIQETYGRSLDTIAFSGSVAQVEAAFHLQMIWYKATGRYAAINDPQVPDQFKGVIHTTVEMYNLGGAILLGGRSGLIGRRKSC